MSYETKLLLVHGCEILAFCVVCALVWKAGSPREPRESFKEPNDGQH